MIEASDMHSESADNSLPGGEVTRSRAAFAACALLLVFVSGAAPPEVVRVRVPADKARAFFGSGGELRGLSVKEFDALVDAAKAGAERSAEPAVPRLLRARHFARWDGDVLTGRSELDVAPAGKPGALPLAPWTPALEGASAPADGVALRVDDTGRVALAIEAREAITVTLHWQLRARAGSLGRGFTLGLPDVAISALELDVPADWTPDGPVGVRIGPSAVGARRIWRFEGRGGLADVRLRGPAGDPETEAPIWVSGPTRIDLGETGVRPNWRAEWTVEADPRGPRALAVELDPGLELIDVNGPGVESFQADARESGTRVAITLKRDVNGPTALTVSALTRAPSEGAWAIPSARPVGALWTGGITTVRLDATRVLSDCRERAGRRVLPRPGENADGRLLVFEASAPRSVAELVFRKPWVDASAEVRGQLLLGNSEPRLRCRLTWKVYRGRSLGLDVDLPPAWVPDEVRVEGSEEPVTWHPETLADGRVRVHVVPSSVQLARSTIVVNLSAVARIAGGRGPLLLPRVRPVGARVADELWLARVGPALTLRPTAARGLAWVDPKAVASASPTDNGAASELNDSLAWRWIADDAEARVDRERVGADPTATVQLEARLDPRRIRLDGRLAIETGDEPIRSLIVGLTEPLDAPERWQFTDEATGRAVRARGLDPSQRAARGLSGTGPAWELDIPPQLRGPLSIRVRYEGAWDKEGYVPLLVLPARIPTRGRVLILADRVVRSSTETTGLTRLDPALANVARVVAADSESAQTSPTYRPAHAFSYTAAANARLLLRTEALEPLRRDGVIEEAALATLDLPGGARRHRLTLRLSADQAQALELTLPNGAELVRVRRDGQTIAPSRNGQTLSIALPSQRALRGQCTIALDYTEGPAPPGASRPSVPKVEWPCVSFSWTVSVPGTHVPVSVGPGLAATDPAPRRSWTGALFGPWRSGWVRTSGAKVPDDASSVLAELDKRVGSLQPTEMTLGEWLTRWDAIRWPLVVDRMTLASAGWGPRSRVMPPGVDAARPGAARAALAPFGLTVVPLGASLLITTREDTSDGPEQADTRAAWESALRQAAVWGSDVSDRFQSVMRWRGETTPKNAGGDEDREREAFGPGWRTWRFAASGWPGPDATVRWRDERSEGAWIAALALGIVVLATMCRGWPLRRRALAAGLVLAAGFEVLASGGESLAFLGAAAVLGGLGAILFWLGRALPLPRPAAPSSRALRVGSTVQTRAGSTVGAFWLIGLILATPLVFAQGGGGPLRVLAVLPYEGPPNVTTTPDRVLLRLDDYKRLRSLAEAEASEGPLVTASAAVHRIDRHSAAEAMVESEYELTLRGGSLGTWRLPIQFARDLSATLDGAPAPITVRPTGREGDVFVRGAGKHRLTVRRRVAVRPVEGGEGFVLPINAVPSARVHVSSDAAIGPVDVRSARGRIETRQNASEGWLGPAGRLELRWPSAPDSEKAAAVTVIDSLLLWDAEPAGDLVRARLTVRNPEGAATLRLRTEAGMSVRASEIPGRVDIGWQGTAERPEWVANIEPPLPDGTAIVLEFWRPSSALGGRVRESELRSLPLIEPLNVRRFAGALAFRRPADWSGRLDATAGTEAITDEAFARQWGTLPDDPLTLAGTTRFVGRPGVAVRTGPVPVRVSTQPEVQLRIGPGRLDVQMKGALVETAGRTDQLEWQIPADLRVIAVEGDGLTDWARPAPTRIRLRFDGAPVASRGVRLQGWLGVPIDPLTAGPPAEEVEVPWPRWVGVDAEPGTLAVMAPEEPRVEPLGGATLVSKEQTGGDTALGAQHRVTYRIDRPEGLGRIRWQAEPARVGVLVLSQLTVDPETAEWLAILRYTVSGGASDVLHLSLPTAWADRASIRVAGDGHRLTSDPRGETTHWTIRPDHPIWGTARLVIRAAQPRSAEQPLPFPNVVPLGRGTADKYLAVVNGTTRELVTEGVQGVQPADYAARFGDSLFAQQAAGSAKAYHVRKDDWRLRILPAEAERPEQGAAKISLADLTCALTESGAVTGLASYEIPAHFGAFLPLHLPEGCLILGTTVNATAAPLLRTPSGRWLVPIDEEKPSAVTVLWSASGARASQTVPVPAIDVRGVPTLVTVRAPQNTTVACAAQGMDPAGPDRLALERASALEQRVTSSLARFDRGALRDREALIGAFVAFELLLRTAERSVFWNLSGTAGNRNERLNRVRERIQTIRSNLVAKVDSAGLKDLFDEARVHAGLAAERSEEPLPQVPEPNHATRIRQPGRPAGFLGYSEGLADPSSLAWSATKPTALEASPFHVAAIVAPILIIGLARPPESSRRFGMFLIAAILGTVALTGGPWVFAAGMTLALGGYWTRD